MKNKYIRLFWTLLLSCWGLNANASSFNVVQVKSSAEISVPYTFGAHHGRSNQVTGSVEMDPQTFKISSAKIIVPIESLDMGKKEMNCHLQEALGLNYNASEFPKQHVCDKDDHLPEHGENSIAYSNIVFEVEPASLVLDEFNTVYGTWMIHGVSKRGTVKVKISRNEEDPFSYKITGEQDFLLKDFGIVVKPFGFVKVKNGAKATFSLFISNK